MEDVGCRGLILCAVKIVASLNCKCNSLITFLDSLYIKICRNGLVSESSENQALYFSYLYTSRYTKWDCCCRESWPQTFKMVVSPWTERLIYAASKYTGNFHINMPMPPPIQAEINRDWVYPNTFQQACFSNIWVKNVMVKENDNGKRFACSNV